MSDFDDWDDDDDRRHFVGGTEFPRQYDDWADIADAAEETFPDRWPDVEWSSEQTFTGEFGHFTQFGDPID